MAPRANSNGDAEEKEKPFRLSLTLDPSIMKKIRIAAAYADMDKGEWCASILERAADKAVPSLPKVRASSE